MSIAERLNYEGKIERAYGWAIQGVAIGGASPKKKPKNAERHLMQVGRDFVVGVNSLPDPV